MASNARAWCCWGWLQASVLMLAMIFAALPAAAESRGQSDYPVRDDGVRRSLVIGNNLAVGDGGQLTRNAANVMVEAHGECRWLDNNNPDIDYFVPTGHATDWDAFRNNAPSFIRIDACCPAATATLTTADGSQSFDIALDVGRSGSSGPLGRSDLSHTFLMNDPMTGATWNETVTEQYLCVNGVWTGQGANTAGGPGGWVTGDWGACSDACGGVQTRSVVCHDASGMVVADSMCGMAARPADSQPCNVGMCPDEPDGTCGDAAGMNRYYDRATPPPADTGRALCATGSATTPVRLNAITWQWECRGVNTNATCTARRTGAAVQAKSDCRPQHMTTPPQNQWHSAGDYYKYVCGVDRRMPKNSHLTPANWQISQMVNNRTAKYSCNKTGFPIVIGSTTGGDDWHKAYYTDWDPRPGTTAAGMDDNANFYMSSRGDQCEGCVVLKDVYCTDEPDYPLGCAPQDVTYLRIPPAAACEPPSEHQGTLPFGYYGQRGQMGDSVFTCGLDGWYQSGTNVGYDGTWKFADTVNCW